MMVVGGDGGGGEGGGRRGEEGKRWEDNSLEGMGTSVTNDGMEMLSIRCRGRDKR